MLASQGKVEMDRVLASAEIVQIFIDDIIEDQVAKWYDNLELFYYTRINYYSE